MSAASKSSACSAASTPAGEVAGTMPMFSRLRRSRSASSTSAWSSAASTFISCALDPAVAQPDDAVSEGRVGVRMRHLHHRGPGAVELLEELHDLLALLRMQVARRLV